MSNEVLIHNSGERIPDLKPHFPGSPPLRRLPPEDEPDDNQHEDHYDQRDAGDYTGPDVHQGVRTDAIVVGGDPNDAAAAAAHGVDARHLLGREASLPLADRLDLEYREGLVKDRSAC